MLLVERLMVEEFANHKFLSVNKSDGDIRLKSYVIPAYPAQLSKMLIF